MVRSERIKERNKSISKDFNSLKNIYVGKVKKYRAEAVIEIISEKYFLSPQTVYDIVYKIGTYAKEIYKYDTCIIEKVTYEKCDSPSRFNRQIEIFQEK